jgi:hypothetical protein
MTAAEQRLFRRTQRYAASLSPDMAAAIVRAFYGLRDAMGESQLARAIEHGFSDRIFAEILRQAVLNVAFAPVREQMRRATQTAFKYTIPDIPLPPRSAGAVSVGFNVLNPRVIDAIQTMETRVITTLETSVRETIRQRVEAGLVAGENPRTIAKGLRDVLGLAPNQELAVRNYEAKLRAGESVNGYTLRNAKYDTATTEKQITKAVDSYRKSMIAHNAETVSRTATLDALRVGQQLSWQDAIDKGIVDPSRLMRRWAGVMDDRERPEHVAMEGDVAAEGMPHSNGQMIPGESDYGCRCLDVYFMVSASDVLGQEAA